MSFEILVTSIVILALLIVFVKQVIEIELAALCAVSSLLILGIIDAKDVLKAFSNPAAATIACMFVLSAALEKSGLIDLVAEQLNHIADYSARAAILVCFASVFVASAFVNNTSVVLVVIPIIERLARLTQNDARKFLIPLSYFAIMGGACTLIGTSTNLLVDAASQDLGGKPFGIFEATIPALIMAIFGSTYLFFFSSKLLPFNDLKPGEEAETEKRFVARIEIATNSNLKNVKIGNLFADFSGRLEFFQAVEHRGTSGETAHEDESILSKFTGLFKKKFSSIEKSDGLGAGDLLLTAGSKTAIMAILEQNGENFDQVSEFYIGTNSQFIGRSIREINIGLSTDLKILGIARAGINTQKTYDSFHLDCGDLILIGGNNAAIENEVETHALHPTSGEQKTIVDLPKLIIATLAMVCVIIAAASNIMPIASAGIIAVGIVILSKCVSVQEAYLAIKPNVLFLIFFMLAISTAMEKSGALAVLIDAIMSIVAKLPPWAVISIIYLITSTITEVFSNSAAALMLTPIALGIAQSLGIDSRALLVTIMLGASASFATPLGYQTNTLVFAAGNYTFADFLRIGLPMNIIMWIVASLVIPAYWGLF